MGISSPKNNTYPHQKNKPKSYTQIIQVKTNMFSTPKQTKTSLKLALLQDLSTLSTPLLLLLDI